MCIYIYLSSFHQIISKHISVFFSTIFPCISEAYRISLIV